jgi:hypothetical protein
MDASGTRSFVKLRPIIFGVCTFDLSWMWTVTSERVAQYAVSLEKHVSTLRLYEEVLIASFLLLASIGLLRNRVWSLCASLILSGFFLYCLTVFSVANLAHNAEVPLFSYPHLRVWYPNLHDGQLLQFALSAVIFGDTLRAFRIKSHLTRLK